MQQKDELNQRLVSSMVREVRPLRDRVGVYIQATNTVDAIARIREAEYAGVQQVWIAMGGAGFADILTVLAAVVTQTDYKIPRIAFVATAHQSQQVTPTT